VLVHCVSGKSRSVAVVLAYLLKHNNMTLAEAYKHVKTVRKIIAPNPNFWRQLFYFEKTVLGKRSLQWDDINQQTEINEQITNINEEDEKITEINEEEQGRMEKNKISKSNFATHQKHPVEEWLKQRTTTNGHPTHMWYANNQIKIKIKIKIE
jgi:hypothetical protein